MAPEPFLNFSQFNTETADFHLMVQPTQEFEISIWQIAHSVASFVKARVEMMAERIANEMLGRQLRPVVIATG